MTYEALSTHAPIAWRNRGTLLRFEGSYDPHSDTKSFPPRSNASVEADRNTIFQSQPEQQVADLAKNVAAADLQPGSD